MRLGHDFQALNYKNVIILWLEACFYNKNKTKIIFANHKSKFWSFNLKTSTFTAHFTAHFYGSFS